MSSTLAQALRQIPDLPETQTERFGVFWSLAVGSELAQRSRVWKVTDKTLWVNVRGLEWISPMKSMERKILARLNRYQDRVELTGIRYEVGEIPCGTPASPVHKIRRDPKRSEATLNGEIQELESIRDRDLRAKLKRLSGKFRVMSVLLASIFIANCAATPQALPIADDHTPLMAQSEAVRIIHARKVKNPQSGFRDPRAYFNYLVALKSERDGDFDKAALNYGRVVQFDSNREDVFTKVVILNQRTGRLDEALEAGQEALVRFPDNFLIRMAVADILSVQNRGAEAYDQYQKIIEKYPTNSRALLMAGATLQTMGKLDESAGLFQKTVLADPSNPLAYHYLGITLAKQDKLKEAEGKFKKAINLRPSLVEARQNLASILEKQNKFDEAIQQYRIILKLDPVNRKIREHLEKIHLIVNSENATSEMPQGQPFPVLEWEDTDIHEVLGAMFFEQAVYLEAIDEFRLVLERKEDKQLRFAIAKVYELFGRVDKAVQEIEEYKEKQSGPLENDVLLHLARLYGLNQEMEKSVEYLSQAVETEPENDRLYHALALAHMSLNQNEQAIEHINKAISLNNKKDSYYFEQGALFERVGKYENAIESMKQTLAINPNHSNAHNFIGYMYATMGVDLDKALSHLEQALVIQPNNGYFLDSLGWIYFKKGQPKKALTHIKRAMIYTEPDPVLYDHLGDVQFSLKNMDEALKAWKTSLVLTLRKLKEPAGEIPDPEELREKIRKASHSPTQGL